MKRVLETSGYTILEVMIVLVISGGLLSSVALMMSGQQARTQFQTSTREMESKLQDIFNDVESGVYPNTGKTKCTMGDGTKPTIQASGGAIQEQGTNKGCVVLGKALVFTGEPATRYESLLIVGNAQNVDEDRDASSITELFPTGFYENGLENTTDGGNLLHSLQVDKVVYYQQTPTGVAKLGINSKMIGFTAGVGAGGDGGGNSFVNPDGGARIVRIATADTNPDLTSLKSGIESIIAADITLPAGAVVCISDGDSDGAGPLANKRRSAVAIGVRLNAAKTNLEVAGQRTATDAYFENKDIDILGCDES